MSRYYYFYTLLLRFHPRQTECLPDSKAGLVGLVLIQTQLADLSLL